MTAYLIVCPLVFLAGLVDSIAGGGGLISLPGYLIAGVPAHLALGTNKMGSTIGTSISAVRLLKHGYLKGKMKMAIASAVCAMTGSVLGAKVSLLVSDSVIRHMMIVVLPIVAYHVLKNKNMGEDENTGTVPYKKMFLISVTAAVMTVFTDRVQELFYCLYLQEQQKWIPAAHPHRRRSLIFHLMWQHW